MNGRGDGLEFNGPFGAFFVGHNPHRKSLVLSIVKPGSHKAVAYFRSEQDALEFIEHFSGTRYEFRGTTDDL